MDDCLSGYVFHNVLGHGTYGKVHKVTRISDGLVIVAKEVPISSLSVEEQEETLNEV